MRVTVLLFSSYAEALGTSTLEMDIRNDTRVGDLLASIRQKAEPRLLPPAMVALNQTYARADALVQVGDEIAIIPPVAGG